MSIIDTACYYFLLFIVYSFMGWLYESIWCSFCEGKLVNRGFLAGPFCPVYGFGALLVILTLSDVKSNLLALFFASIIVTNTLEYLTSYILEKCFAVRWWDYSHYRFNLNGRVCLLGAVAFGTMSVLLLHIIHPWVNHYILRLSQPAFYLLSGVFLGAMLFDLATTVKHLLSLNGRLAEIQTALEQFAGQYKERAEQKVDTLQLALSERFENSEFASERIRALIDTHKFQDRRLLKAFPRMQSTKYMEAFEKIKPHMLTKNSSKNTAAEDDSHGRNENA